MNAERGKNDTERREEKRTLLGSTRIRFRKGTRHRRFSNRFAGFSEDEENEGEDDEVEVEGDEVGEEGEEEEYC